MTSRQKLLLLTSLYIAQGLPYGFFTQALPVLMREQGASLKTISLTSLLFLPWALKFLLAPLVDHVGTRRQWIVPLQLLTAAGAAALALGDYSDGLRWVFFALFLFNVGAAMQDIATDGLAVNLLSVGERGGGNAVQVGAYRIGMILGGGALLWVFAKAGWGPMFVGLSVLLLLCSLPILLMREPVVTRPSVRPPLRELLLEWAGRLCQPGMATFIGLIVLYKFGDSMSASLVGPFMKDSGLATESIALIKGTLGSGATLLGAALGGWLVASRGRRAALQISGFLTALSLLIYFAADRLGGDASWIAAACIAEHVFGGMAVVALFTLMMDACDAAHASTDYTVLACALVIAHGFAVFGGAALADAVGYAALFAGGAALTVLGTAVLVRQIDRGAGPPPLRRVWQRD